MREHSLHTGYGYKFVTTHSPFSPLGFTREYQAYRVATAAIPFPDSRLLAAVRFWSRFPDVLYSESYASFWLEDLPPLLAVDARVFEDLHPDELTEIAQFIAPLDTVRFTSKVASGSLWEMAARKWLYIGELQRAMQCLSNADVGIRNLKLALPIPHSEAHQLPALIVEHLGSDDVIYKLREWIERFDSDWRGVRESGHANLATCVLVERDAAGHAVRGRLRTLEAQVEQLPKNHDADEVIFGHQLHAADDPQVRGAYAALTAMRNVKFGMRHAESKGAESNALSSEMRNSLDSARDKPHPAFFRARFTFADSGREPYGGDSLAFACLVASYGDWWSKELHRERRLISAGTALTGALNADSSAQSVSENSLSKKVERVFYSPLTSLVVPKSNRELAEAEVARLHAQHPARRLRIVTADHAADLTSDGNIMLPERVCLGEYTVRAAAKYSRSLKVQVPILILLLFIAGWLGIPTARAVLDRNPVTIEYTKRGFKAMNQYQHTVWQKDYVGASVANEPPYVVFDLDGDMQNEILYYVSLERESPDNAKVDVFNSDGTLRFRLDPVIPAQYPGDYTTGEVYTAGMLYVIVVQSRPIIVTGANAQNPSRFHLRIWSAAGDSLGWYVNAGVSTVCPLAWDMDSDGVEELIFGGYNIRMRSVSLFVLKASGSFGVSPPFWDEQYDLSRVVHGNQLHYMLFPITDVTLGNRLYNNLGGIHDVSANGFRFDVLEGGVRNEQGKEKFWSVNYYIDRTLRVSRVDVDDSFKARREALVQAGTLSAVRWPAYFQRLQDTVTYWTPSGWMTDAALRQIQAPPTALP